MKAQVSEPSFYMEVNMIKNLLEYHVYNYNKAVKVDSVMQLNLNDDIKLFLMYLYVNNKSYYINYKDGTYIFTPKRKKVGINKTLLTNDFINFYIKEGNVGSLVSWSTVCIVNTYNARIRISIRNMNIRSNNRPTDIIAYNSDKDSQHCQFCIIEIYNPLTNDIMKIMYDNVDTMDYYRIKCSFEVQ